MWVLNQNKLVCELKLHLEGDLTNVESSERAEIYEKVKSVLKENNIEEFYVEML